MFNWSSIMKFAEVNGQRREAQPRLSGNCPGCDSPMVARCGTKRVWHWAHLGERTCDVWWENETEWHRAWKNQFPVEWQEIVHRAENGEKHIADVKTRQGWVLEFQHSPIKPEERQARNDFYRQLIWVVDGTRRKSDAAQFNQALRKSLQTGGIVSGQPLVARVSLDDCTLLQEWSKSRKLVFFDFGKYFLDSGKPVLWCIHPRCENGQTYVSLFPRSHFIEHHRGTTVQASDGFENNLQAFNEIVLGCVNPAQAPKVQSPLPQLRTPRPLVGFERYLARQRRGRRF
jgi:competence protein CoiA